MLNNKNGIGSVKHADRIYNFKYPIDIYKSLTSNYFDQKNQNALAFIKNDKKLNLALAKVK